MGSDKPTGADNQQETARAPTLVLDPHWVVGFVDGEGCFSVSLHAHPGVRSFGWQVNPVFQVSQHKMHRKVLESLVDAFGCGSVRPKGPTSSVHVFVVARRRHLLGRVIPFFDTYSPVVKAEDYERFKEIVLRIHAGEHFTHQGFEQIVRLAFAMNANGKQRARSIDVILAGSSETARQARPSGR